MKVVFQVPVLSTPAVTTGVASIFTWTAVADGDEPVSLMGPGAHSWLASDRVSPFVELTADVAGAVVVVVVVVVVVAAAINVRTVGSDRITACPLRSSKATTASCAPALCTSTAACHLPCASTVVVIFDWPSMRTSTKPPGTALPAKLINPIDTGSAIKSILGVIASVSLVTVTVSGTVAAAATASGVGLVCVLVAVGGGGAGGVAGAVPHARIRRIKSRRIGTNNTSHFRKR